jgi:HEAT repeat protein
MAPSAPVELLISLRTQRIAAYVDRVGVESAAQMATAWAQSIDAQERALGIVVLGQIAIDSRAVLAELLELVRPEDEAVEVRRAIADAIGDQSECERGSDIVLQLVDDLDEAVRTKAIGGLGITLPDPLSPDHPAIATLLRLLDDNSPVIRDWAAFVFGMRVDVDLPSVRNRLLTMAKEDVDTDDVYPAAEAAAALARRGDERIVPVIASRLDRDRVGTLWLEAAAAIANKELVAALEGLRAREADDNDDWDQQLAVALNACRLQQPPSD